MKTRKKLQLYSTELQRWRTVYVRPQDLFANLTLLRAYQIKFRVKESFTEQRRDEHG